MNYQDFIQRKRFKVSSSGFHVEKTTLNPLLFDFQKDIVQWAVRQGNAAIWADCGLGKTPMQLEWARLIAENTKKPVLIFAPLAVSSQTVREGHKFGIDVNICKSQDDVKPGINITNYERIEKFNFAQFAGLVLDESSILKSYMGKIKRLLVDAGKMVQYKLSCTATPAPNDHMELLNQAEFLQIMTSSMALAVWFINKTNELGGYRLKKHAESDFWGWVSSWAVYINSPCDLGYDANGFELPPLEVIDHELLISEFDLYSGSGSFLRDVSLNATSYNKEKRYTLEKRCEKTRQIVESYPDRQFVIWIELDKEGDALKKLLPEAVEVRGGHSIEQKEQSAIDFIHGKTRILISKPSIFGYGLNFQNCADTVFCGLSFSYENYYQAIRRFWRFQQMKKVTAHIVYGSTEKGILQIVRKKEEKHHELQSSVFASLKDKQAQNFFKKQFKTTQEQNESIIIPSWMQ